jgi:predicted O-methyltransferase YrrM
MEHFYKTIPGWAAFAQTYVDMVKRAKDGDHFVEIGSWAGRSAALMAVEIHNSGKKITFDCIDPWLDGGVDLRDTQHQKLLNTEQVPLIDQFRKNLGPVLHHVNMIQSMSLDAAPLYENESIDFIMIDGDHTYEAVRDDIAAYLPKMKPGSIMAGDDYGWPGVGKAVDEAFGKRAKIFGKPAKNFKMGAQHWLVQL